jgi:phosphatidylglycerol:prolipoprotein diacylglycerol transferase
LIEFFREPDSHIGFDFLGWMTRGQILCIPMVLFGAIIIYVGYKRHGQKA